MSRRGKRTRESWEAAPHGAFVSIQHSMLKEPAWRAMGYGARCLYLLVKSYYNGSNNGRIYLGVRRAADELGASRSSAEMWFRELQEHGFLRVAQPSALGFEGAATATFWRLTEAGHMGERATQEFRSWAPAPVDPSRRTGAARKNIPHRKSVQTVPEIGAHRTENRDVCTENRDEIACFDAAARPENRCISTLPYSGRQEGDSDAA